MTKRFGALEAEFQQRAARGLLKEVFPEMAHLPPAVEGGVRQARRQRPPAGAAAPTRIRRRELASDLAFLIRVIQLMEDAWLTCQLDQWWTHPLNLGWINLFARWATSPRFRFWWPLLSPMFSPASAASSTSASRCARDAEWKRAPFRTEGKFSVLTSRPLGSPAVGGDRSRKRTGASESESTHVLSKRDQTAAPARSETTVPLQVGLVGVAPRDRRSAGPATTSSSRRVCGARASAGPS